MTGHEPIELKPTGQGRSTSKRNELFALGLAASEFGISVAAGLLLGLYVDRKLGVGPLFTFLGLFGGLALGFKLLLSLAKKSQNRSKL